MKITNRQLRRFCYYAPIFCSMAVLSSQLQAGPTIQLNGDQSRDGIADSGRIGYVGGNTRIGVSVDRDLQGQVEINQIILDDDSSATSAEGWFGYKIKDDELGSKGVDSGGAKLNHQWVNDEADTVHKVFGAYDQNTDDQSKVTVGYGQETEDLFWAGRVSKGLGDTLTNVDTETRAYDYSVGAEVGTFLESTQTRIRGGLDYDFGTEYADSEDRPQNITISAGVEQFFHDTPHSVTLDVSGNRRSGGADSSDTDYNARLGYRYEFGGGGAYQSDSTTTRRRVEIPGTPARPGRAGRAGVPAIPAQPAVRAQPAIPAQPGRPAQPAIPPRYERQLVKKPGHEFVKTTMKLENETFFKLNSSKLTSSAKRNLDKIIGQVRSHGYVGAVRITGNTCGLGDPIYDQRLSENRANAVRDYLIDQGFNPDHLIARGLGKGSPKYDRADTDFKNRRVDLEFMTERSTRKQSAQSFYKNVLVQEGRPAIAAIPGKPGRAAIPAIPAIPATPGTPSRFVWKTEVVKTAPIWIKRAVRNTIRHDRTINTYSTRADAKATNDSFLLSDRNGEFNVLANDSSGAELLSVTQPANGTVEDLGNGIVRYTPNTGFSGTDTFTYTVRDRDGNEQTATVTVNVPTVVNNAPVAEPGTITTNENTPVVITVVATDADGDALTRSIKTQAEYGTAAFNADGTVTYTPNTGFSGTDSFVYEVNDGNGNTDMATVTVNVTNVNSAPTATNDVDSTPENTAVTVNVLANDSDPDGDALTVAIVGNPSNGTASVVNGQIVYLPNTDFVGTDTITYSITDPDGQEATATVTITVSNVNAAPIATNDARSTQEDTPVTISPLGNDSDPDGDSISIQSFSQGGSGSVTVNGNDFEYTPNAGFVGTDSFTYVIADPDGQTATATVTVTITNVNMAPVAVDDSRTTPENTPVTISSLSNDSDPDGDAVSIDSFSQAGSGSVTVNGSDFVYTPNAGFVGTDSFTYVITDPDGQTATATVHIDVTSTNSAPTPVNDSRSTPQDTPITINVLGNDSDPDGDSFTLTSNTTPVNGSAVINGNNIVYTPDAGFFGMDIFDYTVTDSNGATQMATVTVTVVSTNQAPVAVNDSATTPVNTPITLNVLGNDSDPDGDSLTITSDGSAPNGNTTTSNNQIVYTPEAGFTGEDSFTYTISDGNGNTATAVGTVTVVAPANQPPVAIDDSATTPIDTPITLNVLANDSDPDGDTLTITSDGSAPNGNTTTNNNQIVYTPEAGFVGVDSFTYTISDGNGNTTTAVGTVTVTAPANQPPVAVDDSASTSYQTPITINVAANDTDPDGTTTCVSNIASGPANGFVVISGNGTDITYTPNNGFSGDDTFVYTACDANGGTDTATVTVTVGAPANNTAPVIGTLPHLAANLHGTISFDIADFLSDVDGDNVVISIADAFAGTVTFTGTEFQYSPDPSQISSGGSDTIMITVSDGNGGVDHASITVNVK